jgi:hypothetical protein
VLTAFRPEQVRDYLDTAASLSARWDAQASAAERRSKLRITRKMPTRHFRMRLEPRFEAPSREARPPEPEPAPPRERKVSTGFAAPDDGEPLSPGSALKPGRPYLFWFEVGAEVAHSIERVSTELPLDLLPPRTRLVVALFAFEGELELTESADVGSLDVSEEGVVVVHDPVARPEVGAALERRLYFPVKAPATPGVAKLRCNVYCGGVLVQSRLVSAEVGQAEPSSADEKRGPALVSTLEYTLSRSLDPSQLDSLPVADLSVMMNGSGDLHQLRFFGSDPRGDFKAESSLDSATVDELIKYCREGLQLVSWGAAEEWRKELTPKYQSPPSEAQLTRDLAELAIRGRLTYTELIDTLAGGMEGTGRLAESMRQPGRVEIAAAPDRFIPAAMFYDAPLAAGDDVSKLRLCPDFARDRAGTAPLHDSRCMSGGCPNWDDRHVVCPGSFWGYRHSIGWPFSLEQGDTLGVVPYDSAVRTAIAVADDLAEATTHRQAVEDLLGKLDPAADRDRLLELLKAGDNQVVYLFCHGGRTPGGAPYVRVGAPDGKRLTANELWELEISGGSSLVFLNGCRTTAVSPRQRFDLVSAFVNRGGALGVIGTEITVFEPMAAPFAIDFLRAFVLDGASVGEAVRRARIGALRWGNPLALAYVPFVLGGTVLAPASA